MKTFSVSILLFMTILAILNTLQAVSEAQLGASNDLSKGTLVEQTTKKHKLSIKERFTFLEKRGEISAGLDEKEDRYFDSITSLCVDKRSNRLYIADSGMHRIFIFSDGKKYEASFGFHGQGPGEFLGILRITIGNDGNLYVTDDKNYRLSKFTSEGRLIKTFSIARGLYDEATVNSEGDIFLISPGGIKLIDIFDQTMKLKDSLLDVSYLDSPLMRPKRRMLKFIIPKPSIHDVKKKISGGDHLFILIDMTQMVIRINKERKKINTFLIDHPRFIKDYKTRLKKAISEGGWLTGFGEVFFDHYENLCFNYYNAALSTPEIYRYDQDGNFIDTLRVKNSLERTNRLIRECDGNGNYFSISADSSRVLIYREKG